MQISGNFAHRFRMNIVTEARRARIPIETANSDNRNENEP